MVAKDYRKTKSSTKAEVGEIDNGAPFQSVKDAVSLFGEVPESHSAQRIVAKEMQLHLTKKELNKLKEKLQSAETTKAQALVELDRAKKTVEDITQKLRIVNYCKDSAIIATEMAKHQAKKFAEANESMYMDMETSRVEYKATATILDAAKKEIRKIHKEVDALLKAKDTIDNQEAEAEKSAKSNMERISELSGEIASVQNLIQQVKLVTRPANEEVEISADKDSQKQLYGIGLDEFVKKSISFKKDSDPEHIQNLKSQLYETSSEVEALQNKLGITRADDLDYMKAVTLELNGAKESLYEVAEEGNSLRNLVETLMVELDTVKKDHCVLKVKEIEAESVAGNLQMKLRKAKSELEAALTEEAKRCASNEVITTIHQLASECENTKYEAEKMKQQAEKLQREAKDTRIELKEAEKRLRLAIHEVQEAKAAEVCALDKIQTLSEKSDVTRITFSRDEYESLSRKAEESERVAEMKVAAAMAQAEAAKASANEALERMEAIKKVIEGMDASKEEALKKAEMAEAARKAVEVELGRWREREQKKAAEAAASRGVAETETYVEQQNPREKVTGRGKLEKVKASVAKKVMVPSLKGVFHKKKSQAEGEKPAWR